MSTRLEMSLGHKPAGRDAETGYNAAKRFLGLLKGVVAYVSGDHIRQYIPQGQDSPQIGDAQKGSLDGIVKASMPHFTKSPFDVNGILSYGEFLNYLNDTEDENRSPVFGDSAKGKLYEIENIPLGNELYLLVVQNKIRPAF